MGVKGRRRNLGQGALLPNRTFIEVGRPALATFLSTLPVSGWSASGSAIWIMAAQPGGGVAAGSSPAAPKKSAFWSCFACRLLTGGGLLASGAWVYMGVRQSLRQRPGTPFDAIRLAFAIGKRGWGEAGNIRTCKVDTCNAFFACRAELIPRLDGFFFGGGVQ